MMNRNVSTGLLLLAASTLAACGGGNGTVSAPPAPSTTIVAPAPQENAFGANFAAAFRAAPTAAAVTPVDGDIIPLSLTTEPTRIE